MQVRSMMLMILFVASLTANPAVAGSRARVVGTGLGQSRGLTVDDRGWLYTVDSASGCVMSIAPDGESMVCARVEGGPGPVVTDRLRNLFVGTNSGMVYRVELDGAVDLVGRCSAPITGLAMDRDGGLMVLTGDGVLLRFGRETLTP